MNADSKARASRTHDSRLKGRVSETRPNALPAGWRKRRSAFSLVEIMVAVGLLSFIILGLLAMFSQTQRAFRSSITQTDVLEGGRAVTEMLAREIEQVAPSQGPSVVNFYVMTNTAFPEPLEQDLPGANPATLKRVNMIQSVYFLTEVNDQWAGTGYHVVPLTPNGGIGTLYRFSRGAANKFELLQNAPLAFFQNSYTLTLQRAAQSIPLTNLPPGTDRVIDGVVHFRVRTFAPNGFPIMYTNLNTANAHYLADPYTGRAKPVAYTVVTAQPLFDRQQSAVLFESNAVPAFVELELGILEPQLVPRFKSLPTAAQKQFLAGQAGRVHLFRQRIPVRNVDYEAYP